MPKDKSSYLIAGENEKQVFLNTIDQYINAYLEVVNQKCEDEIVKKDAQKWSNDLKNELYSVFITWFDGQIKGTKIPPNIIYPKPKQDRIYKKFGKNFSNECCEICGDRRVLNIAHIIPRSEKGPDEAWNLMRLCANHHYLFDNFKLSQSEWNSISWKNKDKRIITYVNQTRLPKQKRFWEQNEA